MKKTILLSIVLLFAYLYSSAKIWRVNNNNGIKADFTTVQAAHDGASAGDTLHMEGSPTNYGGLQSSKKLVIIGPGYFLSPNTNLQAFTLTARIDGIQYGFGSEGSVVMGIDFYNNSVNIYCSDIVIKRNTFTVASGDDQDGYSGIVNINYQQNNSSIPANNVIISQNYGVRVDVNYASTGILIADNYFTYGAVYGDNTNGSILTGHVNAVLLIQNNVFRRGKVTVHKSTITNNIMYSGIFEGADNMVSNNISSGTQFGTASGNKSSVDMSSVFVGEGSPDGYYKLKTGSSAIGAGYGSTAQNPVDAGMSSGHTPYVLSGIPPVPSVYFFENQPVGSSSDPIDVTLKVRSNN